MERIILPHAQEKNIEEYVERRISFTTEYAQLNIFDTTKIAKNVTYQYDKPSILSMVSGKKVIWKNTHESYEFVPGETLIIPSSQKLTFDFPDASIENPTQCLTFSIDPDKLLETVRSFSQNTILGKKYCWDNNNIPIHLNYNEKVQNLIRGLVQIFTEEHPSKEMFAELALKDLILRLLQSNARIFLLESNKILGEENRLTSIVKYIQEHLTGNITVDILADKACMSKSNFFKCFKNTFGITPLEYILSERIKLSKKMLEQSNLSLDRIAHDTGFSNAAYLIRQFKKHEQTTPGEYRNTFR
ncbi:helix-turn-helix protein [Arcicella aurantiaca]|uniref:Helix-turn-helix protein n=1 Tax=Arcicella aurantiaca TaxID=591202 RepID=A0A316DFI4_9BACT|nr:AraC family transcriptional regulator [Arcicella aurantiaca]PWK16824.1 helix-turn-helix protein [Arcicella aurantiaca]